MNPSDAIQGLLEFRVPEIMRNATKIYAFTQLSAVEIWSDFAYIQRGFEKSPYFIKILRKDMKYWKEFFNSHEIPNYFHSGMSIGEFVILIPVSSVSFEEKDGFKVDSLKDTRKYAKSNDIYSYASEYIENKYGASLLKANDLINGEIHIRKALLYNPNYAPAYVNLGYVFEKSGDFE